MGNIKIGNYAEGRPNPMTVTVEWDGVTMFWSNTTMIGCKFEEKLHINLVPQGAEISTHRAMMKRKEKGTQKIYYNIQEDFNGKVSQILSRALRTLRTRQNSD